MAISVDQMCMCSLRTVRSPKLAAAIPGHYHCEPVLTGHIFQFCSILTLKWSTLVDAINDYNNIIEVDQSKLNVLCVR